MHHKKIPHIIQIGDTFTMKKQLFMAVPGDICSSCTFDSDEVRCLKSPACTWCGLVFQPVVA